MKVLLLADKPTDEEANERLYRTGMLWARGYKPATMIAGKSMLERAVDALSGAGFDITIVGDPAEPRKLLGDTVSYHNPGHTLGEKFRSFAEYGDEYLAIGGCDICPSKKDAKELYELFQKYQDASFVVPMVRGQALVEIDFRQDLRTKIYHLRDDHSRSERLAFPQMYACRPSHFRLETIACVADRFYKTRENGCAQEYWPLIKEYFREKHADESPGFFRTMTNTLLFSTMVWGAKKKLHDYPVATYQQARNVVAGLVGRTPASDIIIAPNDLTTIACDIDTDDELAILRGLIERGEW